MAVVKGRVTDSYTRQPMPNVNVVIVTDGRIGSITNSQGEYEIGNIKPRPTPYQIECIEWHYEPYTGAVLIPEEGEYIHNIALKPKFEKATLQGKVVDADTGKPISGAYIKLHNGGQQFTTFSDALGEYEITNITVTPYNYLDRYTLLCTHADYINYTANLYFPSGKTYIHDIKLKRRPTGPTTATLKGKVTDKLTGQPIQGAKVTLDSYSAITDEYGDYLISGIEPSTYTITISKSGYQTYTAKIGIEVPQEITHNVSLIPETLKIVGIVRDSVTLQPIAGATITVNGISVITDKLGRYELPDIQPRDEPYILICSKKGYEPFKIEIHIPKGY